MFERLIPQFRRLAPQVAQHKSGYIVQFHGRDCLQYVDGEMTADITVEDISSGTALYPDTMVIHGSGGREIQPTAETKRLIMSRVRDGLKFLGEPFDIVERPAS